MKYGPRKPSLIKSISARTKGAATRAVKKMLVPGYGQKGRGWLTDPEKAAYNVAYRKTTSNTAGLFGLLARLLSKK